MCASWTPSSTATVDKSRAGLTLPAPKSTARAHPATHQDRTPHTSRAATLSCPDGGREARAFGGQARRDRAEAGTGTGTDLGSRKARRLVALLASPLGEALSGSVVTIDGGLDNWTGPWPPPALAPGGEVPTEQRIAS